MGVPKTPPWTCRIEIGMFHRLFVRLTGHNLFLLVAMDIPTQNVIFARRPGDQRLEKTPCFD